MANITIVDDDIAMDILAQRLRYVGHSVTWQKNLGDAERDLKTLLSSDLVVLDIIMPWPDGKPHSELSGTGNAGMELLMAIRSHSQTLPVVVYSAIQDYSIIDALNSDKATTFVPKWEGPKLAEMVSLIHKRLNIPVPPGKPRAFIVHGHNDKLKLELKNYLQNTLKFPEPIILHEQPSMGRTVIEKFEDYAMDSSLAFVLLTPDDIGGVVTDSDDMKRRARQNVIYEMGYFHGQFGRQSGRVLLLYQGPLEIPSDLAGVVYVDVSKGIQSAGELIRKEIESVTL